MPAPVGSTTTPRLPFAFHRATASRWCSNGARGVLCTSSRFAYARVFRIDTKEAEQAPGVKAVVTRADLPTGLSGEDWHLQENTLAGEVALYDGHAVAAVAATSRYVAEDALELIEREDPDFLFTDLQMPHLDGTSLVHTDPDDPGRTHEHSAFTDQIAGMCANDATSDDPM
mgnify:CR=1 FL=1